MTRLKRIKEQIKTDEGLINVLMEFSDFIERVWEDRCLECKCAGTDKYGKFDCLFTSKMRDEGFECSYSSVEEQLIEYVNEEEEEL